MKKWQEYALFILGLGIVGALTLALKPTFLSNEVMDLSKESPTVPIIREIDQRSSWSCDYTWDLAKSPDNTLLLGDQEILSQIIPMEWKLRIDVKDNQLSVSYDTPEARAESPFCQTKTIYHVAWDPFPISRTTPNGSIHGEHRLHLMCEIIITPSFWGNPIHSVFVQELSIDVTDGTADLVRPSISPVLEQQLGSVLITDGIEPDLPRRYCGSPAEQGLLKLLYQFSDIDQEHIAEKATPILKKQAEKLVNDHAQADLPWPECWGDAADMAKQVSRRATTTLIRLQQQECYKNQELADFINSPLFARVFGEKFEAATEPVQTEPIDFRQISPEEMEQNEKD